MSRIALSLMATLFFLFGSLNAQEVHYYLYEYTTDDGKAAIILEVASDNPTSPGSEFSEVTADQLHEKGYKTPSESESSADVIDEFEDTEMNWGGSSWIDKGYKNNNTTKWVVCGSKTSRSFFEGPGTLFVACTTYRAPWNPPGPQRPVFIREYTTWGYWTKLTYPYDYSASRTYWWLQKGRHHIGDPSRMRYTSAGCIW
jgi:hypothetical protein